MRIGRRPGSVMAPALDGPGSVHGGRVVQVPGTVWSPARMMITK